MMWHRHDTLNNITRHFFTTHSVFIIMMVNLTMYFVSLLELFSITIDPKYDVKYGESVTLKCNISCNPKPTTIQWKKNGEILSRTTNTKYTGGSLEAPSLTIVDVDIQDAGLYVCTIQKDDLQSSDSTQLIVECGKIKKNVFLTIFIKRYYRIIHS